MLALECVQSKRGQHRAAVGAGKMSVAGGKRGVVLMHLRGSILLVYVTASQSLHVIMHSYRKVCFP
jgi:hypothetical protein